LIGGNIPQCFGAVKENISMEKKYMIKFSEFKSLIATKFSITDASDIKALLDYLTQTSQVIYFKEKSDSEWLFTDAQWLISKVALPIAAKLKFTKAEFIDMLKDTVTQEAALVILALFLRNGVITASSENSFTLNTQISFLLTKYM